MASSYGAARVRAVLSVGPITYRWRDVEALARHTGGWSAFERQVRSGLAALSAARSDGMGPSEDEVRDAGRTFRRQRGLHAAEDAERWLADRQLTVADWRGWLRVQLARQGSATQDCQHQTDQHQTDQHLTDQDLDTAHWVHGVCSGTLGAFADQLAAMAAIFDRATESDGSLRRTTPPPPDQLVAAHDRVLAAHHQPERLRQAVRDHQLEWTLVRVESVIVATDDIAREAVAGLADGQPIEEVAALAGTQTVHVDGPLAQVPDRLRTELLAASPGDVLGPIPTEDGWAALRLRDRRRASLDQPEVDQAARHTLDEQLAAREVVARVTWHERV